MYKASLYINGQEIEKTDAPRIEVINPATEEVLGSVPSAGPAEVAAAVAAAQSGFNAWKRVGPWERSTVMRRIASLIRERAEDIATTLTLEIGKPIGEARGEVMVSAEYFDWCADEARRIFGHSRDGRTPGSRFDISYEPVGIVLALTAWNYPVILPARKLAMALAAGCAVIVRPAEESPACVAALVRCCQDGGLPPGTVNLLFGSPEAVVEPLMANPAIRKISFTGSTRVGRLLIRQSAETVKRVTMELGGHAPFLVLEDADIDNAVAMATLGKYRNAGQVCSAPSRFFVHQSVASAFTERMAASAKALRVGNGLEQSTQMGPLATARQRDRAERLVADARAKGANVVCGGGRPKGLDRGYFYEPTILNNLPDDAAILAEEPFTPVAAIVPVASTEEAIRRANALEFGLAAYVFSRSGAAIDAVTAELEAGVIGVNNVAVAVAEAPFGGVKQSGFGREGGQESLHEYLNPKFVHKMRA